MAIQLNERDHQIFKLIAEHQVLLEKHISWFISGDEKPVLIRDRLRKLFYLDYLLCQRHTTKLSWWTTPTKPLVYMLSPMSQKLSGSVIEEGDLSDCELQRHLLEVANVRMLCLAAQKAGEITGFNWTTCNSSGSSPKTLDAIIKFVARSQERTLGLLNHAEYDKDLAQRLELAFSELSVDTIVIVFRDENHQELIRRQLCQETDGQILGKVLSVSHYALYKSGIVNANWNDLSSNSVNLIEGSFDKSHQPLAWKQSAEQSRAASA